HRQVGEGYPHDRGRPRQPLRAGRAGRRDELAIAHDDAVVVDDQDPLDAHLVAAVGALAEEDRDDDVAAEVHVGQWAGGMDPRVVVAPEPRPLRRIAHDHGEGKADAGIEARVDVAEAHVDAADADAAGGEDRDERHDGERRRAPGRRGHGRAGSRRDDRAAHRYDSRGRMTRLCVARPTRPSSSYSADSASPLPVSPNEVRASRQIHCPCGGRSRLIVRSLFTKMYRSKSSTALIPLPESAATATVWQGSGASPSTSGWRSRNQAQVGPAKSSPLATRVSTRWS